MGRMMKVLESYKTAPLEGVEFTDRYGGHAPPWLRGCKGHCEAMGCYPLQVQARPGAAMVSGLTGNRLEAEEARREGRLIEVDEDGWAWVRCGVCNGTGVQSRWEAARTIPRLLRNTARGMRSAPTIHDGLLMKWGPLHTRLWQVRYAAVELWRGFTWDPPKGSS
jgi:hypothetical protein